MQTMFVVGEALNLRSAPDSSADNRVGSLYLTQPVEVLGDAGNGWAHIKAKVSGTQKEGFVVQRFLRPAVTPNREALIASVSREFLRFKHGLGKEHVAPFAGFVGEMWKAIGNNSLDGTDRDVPWSAAAISFMVQNAGNAYKGFRFAPAHSKFIHHAIRARINGDISVPFWGFRLHEQRPQIGDIVARDNPGIGPVVNFDVAKSLDSYRSHTDIVVHIDSAKQRLLAIGGNLSDSVGIAFYDLAPGDFLADTNNTFALLRNRTDD
jgi:hypothetical protein